MCPGLGLCKYTIGFILYDTSKVCNRLPGAPVGQDGVDRFILCGKEYHGRLIISAPESQGKLNDWECTTNFNYSPWALWMGLCEISHHPKRWSYIVWVPNPALMIVPPQKNIFITLFHKSNTFKRVLTASGIRIKCSASTSELPSMFLAWLFCAIQLGLCFLSHENKLTNLCRAF